MKLLICLILIMPTLSFSLDKCQKEVSSTDTLFYKVNKMSVYPTDENGKLNIKISRDLILNDKFGQPAGQLEAYSIGTYKINVVKKVYLGFVPVTSHRDSIKISDQVITVNHSDNEFKAKKKAELLGLIDNALAHSNSQDQNILYLQLKNGDFATIDFRLPLAANPISQSKNGVVTALNYELSPYHSKSPILVPNTAITHALSANKYDLEECDESVSTLVRSEKKTMGIFHYYTSTVIPQETAQK